MRDAAPHRRIAGRLIIAGLGTATEASQSLLSQLDDLRPGAVLLHKRNVVDAPQVTRLIRKIRDVLPEDVLIATDEEGGRVSAFREILGTTPSARELATRSASDLRSHARAVGARLQECGVDWNLAPVADLDGGPRNGPIGDRSFSLDPMQASISSSSILAGLRDASILACAKHFPGLGRARTDTHDAEAGIDVTLDELTVTDIAPFRRLIAEQVPAVMVGHAIYPSIDPRLPASVSSAAYVLLRQLGFRGAAITDSLTMRGVIRTRSPGAAAVKAVASGADMVLSTSLESAFEIRDALVSAADRSQLPQSRLLEAEERVRGLAQFRQQ